MLATGIASVTTIFAVVDKIVFEPVRAATHPNVYKIGSFSVPVFETLHANLPEGVDAVTAFEVVWDRLIQIPGRAERADVWRIGGGYSKVLSAGAMAGRWISDTDNVGGEIDPKITIEGHQFPLVLGQLGADVAVISHRLWKEWFNASLDVVTRGSIQVDGRPMQIVGVAAAGFEPTIDVWTPFGRRRPLTREELELQKTMKPSAWIGTYPQPGPPTIRTMVRVEPATPLAVVSARLAAATQVRMSTRDLVSFPDNVDVRILRTGYVILGFAALIFVAACANLGNMLFARATDREGELATRMALGASRWTIFGLLFSETVIICAAAAAIGLGASIAALRMFASAVPAFQISYWQSVRLDLAPDWRIVSLAIVAGAIAAVAVGLGSLRRSSRVSLLVRLAAASSAVVTRNEGRALRTLLVAIQVTAAVLLLITTGMLLENTSKRLNRRLMFNTSPVTGATVELPGTYDESRGQHFFEQLVARVRSIDGVSAAAVADALPGGEAPSPQGGMSAIATSPPERGLSGVQLRLDGSWIHVSPGLLDTLGIRLVRGRDVTPADVAGSDPVVMVSEAAASALWPGQDPLGRPVWCCGARYARRVVGIVTNPVTVKNRPLTLNLQEAIASAVSGNTAGAFVFLPATQQYKKRMLILARSDAPAALTQPLRDAVVSLDPAVPVFDAGPVDTTQFRQWKAERSVRLLAGILGFLSLAIAIMGVYAVVSYFVSRRTREFGLRLALGSSRGQIIKLVIDHAIHMVLIGLLPGVLLASWGTRVFQAELVSIHPNGLTAWILVPLLLLAAAVVAAYIPARRASRVEPIRTLKEL